MPSEHTQFKPRPALVRFIEKLSFEDGPLDTQSWVWTGAKKGGTSGQEYGNFRPGNQGKPGNPSSRLAHLWVYETFVKAIPKGMTIDHLCRTQLCCNPQHMELVTFEENRTRADTARRAGGVVRKRPQRFVSGAHVLKHYVPGYREQYEERAAVREYEGGFPRALAEDLAYEDLFESWYVNRTRHAQTSAPQEDPSCDAAAS